MRKKKTITQRNILIGVLIFFIFSFVLIVGLKNTDLRYSSSNKQNNISNGSFESKYLQFSVNLPNGFQATDETSRIIINSDSGTIYVNRNGTQFDNLDSYLEDFDQQTNLNINNEEKIVINGYNSAVRVFESTDVTGGKEKIYFIFADNFVYKLSTTQLDLYDELDLIAKSFRYTGE